MKNDKKSRKLFIGFVYLWSYLFWGLAIFLAIQNKVTMLENADLLDALLNGSLGGTLGTITILSALAGFGPMLGALLISFAAPQSREHFKNRFRFNTPIRYFMQVIALFILITLLPMIPMIIINGLAKPLTASMFGFLLLFFVYQFFTAGTEEIGWRGYLLPSFLREKTPWKASVAIGIIWSLWHTPIVLYVFYAQGLPLPQIILSFAGFIAGTIAMSAVHTYFYLKTKNVLFNMFIHALSNTLPMFAGLLLSSSYEVSVAVQLLLWGFVIYITKKNKVLFDTVQDVSHYSQHLSNE